ncbi:MAG: methionyl-tRNA formyltransferase [Candidatus Roizmanbacteria bacterium]
MNIAFFGAPSFASEVLQKIVQDMSKELSIALIITQPDAPVGKKKKLTPTPVKVLANSLNIEVFDTELTKNTHALLIQKLQEKKIELALLFAFGKIIPQSILDTPKYGFWNIHPSLLPLYRGPAPITFPLVLGDFQTGVTLMQMDAGMDHGPIIEQASYEIGSNEQHEDLENKLSLIGFELFSSAYKELQNSGSTISQPQFHDVSTYTRICTKQDGYIPIEIITKALNGEDDELYQPEIVQDFIKKNQSISPPQLLLQDKIFNLYRGLHGWPGIWTKIIVNGEKKRLKILLMAKDNNTLSLKKVQLEGKNPVDFDTFNTAYKIW